ncbi:glycosyltransferase family A protein [Rhizomonospora bruguierae]|uniref:glycosyltransferase family A protein n=1 Tax=Rhizomonospora bruguierae TaxID=1581705 RepID=UPI001BCE8010|nr:glycosyltransferase family A protein [Micromonospora sp. NBRC 107566]
MIEHRDDVAVIVPNYNKTKTLRACLESVYAQTYRPAEVIVVDDCSTDGSLDIARSFPCRIVKLAGNQGPSGARNAGVAASTTPLLFFVDSDTALAPDAIENAVKAYRETPDCGMVQGVYDTEPLYDDGMVEQFRVAWENFDRTRSTATFLSCTLIPRAVFDEAGGLDERLRDGEDFEFGTRVPARYRLVVTESVVTRADDEDQLLPCLWERFIRSSTLPVIVMRARRLRHDGATGFRLDMIGPAPRTRRRPPRISSMTAALTLSLLPVVFLVPWLVALQALVFLAFLAVNLEFFRFAYRLRGARFGTFVVGMQLLYHAVFFFGAGLGLLRVAYELLRGQGEPIQPGVPRAASAGAHQ